ncbi:SMI1/KNR4 family protein [Streptomyces griseoincarnatus]|uniref:SMI1/KNR4 family protein n=1 Tax=Streptomyces sp. OS603R TaxID=3035287 RepID=UPI002434F90E|nr:SMI1/KNR4 family protein [Streptomyces sp. OS603R]
MGDQELLDAVDLLARPGGRELVCARAGHGAGHVCLVASDAVDLSALRREFSRRYGQLRNLVMGGYADPKVTGRTGLPLLAPFGGELAEMRGWACGDRWIGCGAVRAGDGVQVVVLVAERDAPPAEEPPEEIVRVVPPRRGTGSDDARAWVRRVLDLTGWEPLGLPVDWATVEEELGVPLPADYKELAEAFGGGVFSESVYFMGCGTSLSFDLPAQWRAALSAARDGTYGSVSAAGPYDAYTPGGKGIVTWGSTEWADQYCWLIDAERPCEYPVLARSHDPGPWYRYDMSTAEFLHRVLAGADFRPFGIARYDLGATFVPESAGRPL